MAQQQIRKPVPVPSQESDFYWEKAKQHELWVRKCKDCNKAYFYPRDLCPNCYSRNVEWIQASGKGTLHTFTIVVRAPHPAWRDDAPFVVCMVDLEEGARMPANLVGTRINPENPEDNNIKIGSPVQVDWEERSDEITMPIFRLA